LPPIAAAAQPAGWSPAPGPPASAILAVQQQLAQLGYDPGPADGLLGPDTRDAIIRLEAANKLPIDPRISARLLAALRTAFARRSSLQVARAYRKEKLTAKKAEFVLEKQGS
jgi:peptidoglycan hydrolase-like protein with peptidoglycan-binding domain